MNQRKWTRIAIAVVVILIAWFAANQAYNKYLVASEMQTWRKKLDNAHLIGMSQKSVAAYIKQQGLTLENSYGRFDYDYPQAHVNANGTNRQGTTYTAIVFTPAVTFEPLPLDWMINLNFQFDRKGKLLFYKLESDTSGM